MKRALAILAVLFLLPLMQAAGQDVSSQKNKKARLEKEIAMIEQQLRENAQHSVGALNTLTLVRKKVGARESMIAESDREIKAIDDSIAVQQAAIDALQARLDTMGLYYDHLIKSAYKNRDSRIWYMYILASDNIGQAARRYSYLRTLSGKMNEQARRINESKAELEVKLEEQKQMRERAEQLRQQRKAELTSLRKEEQQSQNLVSQLNREKKKYQNELNSKKKQVDALNREIQRLIANEIKASGGGKGNASSSKKATRKVDTKLAAEFAANQGRLPWPCEGVVVEHFGQHNHPVYTNLVMPFNNGVDISVSRGTKAHAVFNGEVRKVIVMPGYNNCVLVQHGDYFTFYCKLGVVGVKAGDKVKTGDVIGVVDTIDSRTCLHFQLWKGNKPQNPENWLMP